LLVVILELRLLGVYLLLTQILSGATKLKYVPYTIKCANSLAEIVYRIHL